MSVRKPAVLVLVLAASTFCPLLVLAAEPGPTKDGPVVVDHTSPRLKALRKEAYVTAKELYAMREAEFVYRPGRNYLDLLLPDERKLLDAQRAQAGGYTALQEHLKRLKSIEARTADRLKKGDAAPQDLALARLARLEAEEEKLPASAGKATLRQERLQAAKELYQMSERLFQAQTDHMPADTLLAAAQSLLQAELALCERKPDRVAALTDHVNRLKKIEQRAKDGDLLTAKLARLEAEVELAEQKEPGATPQNADRLKKRYAAAKDLLEFRFDRFRFSRDRFLLNDLLTAADRCVRAKLALAERQADRLAVLEGHLQLARTVEAITAARVEQGTDVPQEGAAAKLARLDAEMRREEAKLK